MSNIHKSSDGKWRPCTASIRGCGVKGGHVDEKAMFYASSALAFMGINDKTLNAMSAKEVETLAQAYSKRTNANTPAFLLSGAEDGYIPQVGLVLNLEQGRTNRSDSNDLKIRNLIKEANITGSMESVKISRRRPFPDTQVLDEIAQLDVTLEQTDAVTGEKRSVLISTEYSVKDAPSSISSTLRYLTKKAAYAESFGVDESLSNMKEVIASKKVSPAMAERNVRSGFAARKVLIDLFGEEKYKQTFLDA